MAVLTIFPVNLNPVQSFTTNTGRSEFTRGERKTIALESFLSPSMAVLCIIEGKCAGLRAKTVEVSGHLPNTTHIDATGNIQFVNIYNMNSNNTFFDDIYISDADTQSPLGQIVSKRVNGAGNLTQFSGTPTGNTTHYLNVDEIPPNGKTDYNISGSSSEYDLYALEDSATSPAISTSDSINGVKAVWQTWRSSGSSQGGTHDNAWRENGTNNSSAPGMGTSPINWTTIWESPPESGGTWNTAKLDGLELGARHNGTQAQTTSISYAAAMVDYTSASLVPEVALFLTPLAFVAPKLLKSIQQGTLKEDIMQMLLKVFSVVPGILKQWRNLFFRVKKKREQKEKQKWRAEYVPII